MVLVELYPSGPEGVSMAEVGDAGFVDDADDDADVVATVDVVADRLLDAVGDLGRAGCIRTYKGPFCGTMAKHSGSMWESGHARG